ncbi:NAD(P)-binding protein [Aspergillus heteromorphus CBS 117.55]|uniref:NAD(P)-binding protein n=1 Tax=Aspergillus heteromorphus CBS 117.55 TaxID=1448321 RepID=A0A317WHE9_9EURO|nr:NAD(P)-binding protein [Aspergillus heteromorphus CBS 117.55]PWY83630.1 NAD(P)-binding protein [Aspergillus heteromorphus CBS 117.55]
MSLFSLSGKTALVTGGTRGIGQAIVLGLAEHGADIILCQRSSKPSDTQSAVEGLGRQCHIVECDLADRAQVETLISRVVATHKVDILVNGAGIQQRREAANYDLETYDAVMQTNLTAPFILCRDIGRHWLSIGQPGRIINLASLASFQGGVNMAGYAGSKGGVLQLTKAFSNEWAGKGINVNAIAPGYIATDMNLDTRTDPQRADYFRSITERIPAGRWGNPEDFKGIAVFLASPASNYISGESILVDGGWMGR